MALDATNRLIPVALSTYTRITAPAARPLRIPRCHNSFNRIRLRNVTYLTFCFEMEKLNRPLVIDRREMEIAWATFLLKFFRLWEGDEQARIRRGKRLEEGEPTWKDQWEALKTAFRDMSSAHTHKYYWKSLPAKLGIPDLDVSVIPLTQWTSRRRPYRGEHDSEAAYEADLAAWEAEWRAEREEVEDAELEKFLGFYEREFELVEEEERRAERMMAGLAEEVAGMGVRAEGGEEDGDEVMGMGADVDEDGDVEMM